MESDVKLVRYADDFVILSRSQKRIERALIEVDDLLEDMGLDLHPEKTRITNFDKGFRFLGRAFVGDLVVPLKKAKTPKVEVPKSDTGLRLFHIDRQESPTAMELALVESLQAAERPIPPPLFVVFGYGVRQEAPVPIQSKETEWSEDMAILYLVRQGTAVRKEHGRFVVEIPDEENIEIPIREVERILVFGNCKLSSSTISACLGQNIPVAFLSQMGEYKGQLGSVENQDIEIERSQFQRQADANFSLELSRAVVWGKLMNSRQLLMRLNRKRKIEEVRVAIDGISTDIDNVEATDLLDSLRGYEGKAAARYFPAFGKLIQNEGFQFEKRHHRPPTDLVNSLLSFGYSLLFENVFSFIVCEGMTPYIGHFHYGDRQNAYLAFDLMEEFRSPIVDSLVLKLINTCIVKPTDFSWPTAEKGVYLTKMARRVFLKHFENRMNEAVSHPDIQGKVSYRRAIHLQVKRYKRYLLEEIAYEPFLRAV